jgi:HNH endonuclease
MPKGDVARNAAGKFCGPLAGCVTVSLSAHDRFWSKVKKTRGCWLWMAGTSNGYGTFRSVPTRVGTRVMSSHQFAYEQIIGPVPNRKELHHVCRNRRCVRPDEKHVRAVTYREHEHLEPGFWKKLKDKTHCPSGHAYDERNTLRLSGASCLQGVWQEKGA